MPLPLIPAVLGFASLVAGALGLKRGVGGVGAMKEAARIGKDAEQRHHLQVEVVKSAHAALGLRIEQLEAQKRALVETTFRKLIEFLERLDQSARVAALESLGGVGVSREAVRAFVGEYLEAGGTLSGGVASVLAGAGASSLTTGAVTAAATTAGGTAISGLSGAALNNAVLAWLGGGSLASGGLGMAGGAVVLGGITVAPALLVAGFVVGHQGEKAKTKAVAYATEVDKKIAELVAACALLDQCQRRVDELGEVLTRLNTRAQAAIDALWELDGRFDIGDDQHLARFSIAMQLAKALSEVMRAPILTTDGTLDAQTAKLLENHRRLLDGAAA